MASFVSTHVLHPVCRYEERKQEREAKYQGMNLYIKNLSDEMDDDELRKEFAAHGTITSAKVMRDSNVSGLLGLSCA